MSVSSVPPRTVAVIGAVCLTVGWLLASTLTPPVARLQSLPERQTKAAPAAEDVAFTEQLHARLRQLPDAPEPRRNPFVFGGSGRAKTATTSSSAATENETANTAASVPAVPVGPIFTLAGIGITGTTRTAILTDGQAVHLLKIGENVGGYDVVEITDNSVTLAESSGLRWMLRLR